MSFLPLGLALGTLAAIAGGSPPFDAFGHPYAVDLSAQLTGGWLIAHHPAELYQPAAQFAAEQALLGGGHPEFFDLYASPPVVAFLYAPLASLPYAAAAAIWTAISLACVVASVWLLWKRLPGLPTDRWWTLLFAVLSAWPVLELLLDGQDSGVILLLYVVGFVLLARGRDVPAGLVLSLTLLKPQLGFLVPFALARQRPRALAGWSAGTGALAGFTVTLVGPTGLVDMLHLVSGALHAGNAVYWWKAESLPSLLEILLPSPFGPLAAALGVIVGVGLVWFGPTFRRHWTDETAVVRGGAILALLTALCAPHFLSYDATLLVYPALVLLGRRGGNSAVRGWIGLGWLETLTLAIRQLIFSPGPLPFRALAAPLLPIALLGLLGSPDVMSDEEELTAASTEFSRDRAHCHSEPQRGISGPGTLRSASLAQRFLAAARNDISPKCHFDFADAAVSSSSSLITSGEPE